MVESFSDPHVPNLALNEMSHNAIVLFGRNHAVTFGVDVKHSRLETES